MSKVMGTCIFSFKAAEGAQMLEMMEKVSLLYIGISPEELSCRKTSL